MRQRGRPALRLVGQGQKSEPADDPGTVEAARLIAFIATATPEQLATLCRVAEALAYPTSSSAGA